MEIGPRSRGLSEVSGRSPTNFWGVDLLRLVMLLASRSMKVILSEEGWRTESGMKSTSRRSSPVSHPRAKTSTQSGDNHYTTLPSPVIIFTEVLSHHGLTLK